ncbi:MAG: secretin N-terminal domain-containing protein [bacterium]
MKIGEKRILKLNVVLLLCLSTIFLEAQPYSEEIKSKEEVKVIKATQSQDNSEGISTSKGRLQLNVDVADDAGIDTISELITLKHIKASEIEPFIKARLSRYGTVQTNDTLNMLIITDKELKVRDLAKLVRGLDIEGLNDFLRLETEVIPLKYALASSLTQIVKERLSSDGTIQADDNLNSLIITDVKSKIDYAKKIIALLDIPTQQVLVEAKIIEASGELRDELGIDWWVLGDLFPWGSIDYSKDTYKYRSDNSSHCES